MSPVSAVLCSSELLSLVCRYQSGLYEDMIPFRALDGYHKHFRPLTFDPAAMTNLRACLRPWLRQHGHTRLHCLWSSPNARTAAVLLYAMYFGDLALVRALAHHLPTYGQPTPKNFPLIEVAAKGGSLPVFDYLSGLGYRHPVLYLSGNEIPLWNCHDAISSAEFYSSLPPEPLRVALNAAIQDVDVDQLELLLPQCHAYMQLQALVRAVHYSATPCVRALHAAGVRLECVDELAYPARMGQFDILEFMLDHDDTHTRVDMLSASLNGAVGSHDVDLVRQVLNLTVADEAVVEPRHLTFAFDSNSVEIVQVLWERRRLRQWRDDAASTWTKEYPKWLRRATQHGWLELMQCLVTKDDQNAFDWTKVAYDAARARQTPIVKWLVESGMVCPDVPTLEQLMVEATGLSQSHLKASTMDILSFVKSLLPPTYRLPTSFVEEAATNEAHVFQFFMDLWWPTQDLETRASVGEACLLAAAAAVKQKNVKLLVSDFHIGVTSAVVDAAKQSRSSKNLIAHLESCCIE
ncbi:Aste57867_2607 [Aphanomyces stellatus]|uniref:Aste57867_2607 protein n=1 Tax=Aphanomyces stellatus TaxID=120398 RepID=A0A485K7Z7_9STRA|nr:hypothetical protein As57867_002600 [Aphanomyces stellatus]VFT79803.1 Aste57867_2607 [Aphanomyces stellatus]